jgi:hypothetical protein
MAFNQYEMSNYIQSQQWEHHHLQTMNQKQLHYGEVYSTNPSSRVMCILQNGSKYVIWNTPECMLNGTVQTIFTSQHNIKFILL